MKSYSNNLRTEFYRDNFVAIDLVRLDTLTPRYFATGGADITYDGNTYTAQGDFIGFSSLSEDFDVKVGKFTIYLSGVFSTLVNTFVNQDYEGRRVRVYKVFLNRTTGEIVDSTAILMFDGQIYNVNIQEGSRTCQINIECSTLFADFERSAGRKTNNASNWLFQGSTADKTMSKSGFVGSQEFRWGKK